MKCRTCGVAIPGENGSSFYAKVNIKGVQCESCAVEDYRKSHPFGCVPLLKSPRGAIVDTGRFA